VIIYEPDSDMQKLMHGMAKSGEWTWVTFVTNQDELNEALDNWWSQKIG
jgi:hypothetical protein